MVRTNGRFVDECPECGELLTLEVSNRYSEMYCKACGFADDPRVQFKNDRTYKLNKLKFRHQQEIPLD